MIEDRTANRQKPRMLVIDDEPMLRHVMEAVLHRRGDVAVRSSVAAAIELIEAGGSIDLILCDLMLEHGTGDELHNWLCDHRPDLLDRIGYVTGGPSSDHAFEFLQTVRPPYLLKPFSRQELLDFVDSIVDPPTQQC